MKAQPHSCIKKTLSIIVTIVLIFGLAPSFAWANPDDGGGSQVPEVTLLSTGDASYNITLYAGDYGYFYDDGQGNYPEGGSPVFTFSCEADWSCWPQRPDADYDGYCFIGWYLDQECTVSINDAYEERDTEHGWDTGWFPSGDTSLYAKYAPAVTITLNAGEYGYFDYENDRYENWSEEGYPTFTSRTARGEVYSPQGPISRDGYCFEGWYLDEELTTPLRSVYSDYEDEYGVTQSAWMPIENISLYANYIPTVTITFNTGEHGFFSVWAYDEELYTYVESQTDRESASVGMGRAFQLFPYSPGAAMGAQETCFYVNSGYSFAGWYLDPDFTDPVENHFTTYINEWGGESRDLFPTEDLMLYAKYIPLVNVTLHAGENGFFYYDNEGNFIEEGLKTVLEYSGQDGSCHARSPEPCDGFIFAGWFFDEAFSQPLEDAYTSYIDPYGCEQFGWFPTEDTALYAKYVTSATITLDAGEHGYFTDWVYNPDQDHDEEVETNSRVIKTTEGFPYWPEAPQARDGYSFVGWYLDEALTSPVEDAYEYRQEDYGWFPIDGAILYAKYNQLINVTLDANGGVFSTGESQIILSAIESGNPVSILAGYYDPPTREGEEAVFAGWAYTQNATEALPNDTILEEGVTLYAVYDLNIFVVTLDANGGRFDDGSSTRRLVVRQGEVCNVGHGDDPAEAPNKKLFAGWALEGGSLVLGSFIPVTETVLRAKWVDAVTVIYETNTENPDIVFNDNSEKVYYEEVFKGHEFELLGGSHRRVLCSNVDGTRLLTGWNTEPDGRGEFFGLGGTVSLFNDMHLYGQWEDGIEVTFHANTGGVDGKMDSYNQDSEESLVALLDKPLKDTFNLHGYRSRFEPFDPAEERIFLGWTADPSGSKENMLNVLEDFVPSQGNVDLYAVWGTEEEDYFTVITILTDPNAFFPQVGPGGSIRDSFTARRGEHLLYALGEPSSYHVAYRNENITDGSYKIHAGWKDETGKTIDESRVVTGDISVNPVWADASKVVFDSNGGVYRDDVDPVLYFARGKKIRESHSANEFWRLLGPKREGFVFTGWNTKKDGTGTTVDMDYAVPSNVADFVVYAQWDSIVVRLSHNKLTLDEGNSLELTAEVLPEARMEEVITWSSNNTKVATVDEKGRITAIKAGQAEITATAGEGSATCLVTVPIPQHTCVADNAVIEDIVVPTCTKDGSHEEVTYCSLYGEELSRVKRIDKALGHSYGTWTKLDANQHQRVCSHDKTHVERANHTWDAGKVTKAATVSATGIKTYTCSICKGTKTEVIPKLNKTSIANAVVSGMKDRPYTGGAQTQLPTVKVNGVTLNNGTDFTLSYKNNVKVGTATMTITAKGNYMGAKSVSFKISKAAPIAESGKIGWNQNDCGWWYKRANGTYPKNAWEKVSGKWYHFDSLGYMNTKWFSEDGAKYWLDSDGAMRTGWQKISGSWYYFSGSGAMQKGWLKTSGTWYYLDKSTGVMCANEWREGYWLNSNGTWTYKYKGTWKKDSKGWWFGDKSGWYAKNCAQKIDGKNYNFNSAGYCTNP